MAEGFALGVDLGTSNTVAVLRWPDGRTRPLLFDGVPLLPSAVYLNSQGGLHVGRDALRLAALDPARLEPNPKRRIDEATVLLGSQEVSTVDLLAAVLAAVARAAVEAAGFLPPAVLTYPASWGSARRAVLAGAAGKAGWPPPRLVPEPVAAARYFADVLRRPVPVGAAIAVFDFGAGTLDVAVVRNTGTGFVVLGAGGVEDLGGLDVDAALVEHLGRLLAGTAPATWAALARPNSTALLRDRGRFWDDVRGAKEMLSRTPVAPVPVPGQDQAVHLTREELDRLAAPLMHRAVYETAAVIHRCGLRPDQLAGLFLVGGSSRLPIVARQLHAQLGVAPTVLEQPELPVAEGALAELVPAVVSPAGAPVAVSAPPTSPAAPLPGGVPGPPPGLAPRPGRPWYRRPLPWVAAAAAVVLLAAAGIVALLLRDRSREVSFTPGLPAVAHVPVGGTSLRAAYAAVHGDHAYLAYQQDRPLTVVGYDLAAGKKTSWTATVDPPGNSSVLWEGLMTVPDGLLVLAYQGGGDQPRSVTGVRWSDGHTWQHPMASDDRVFPMPGALVVTDRRHHRVLGLDPRTGDQKWVLPDPEDQSGRDVATFPVLAAADLAAPTTLSGAPAGGSGDDRLVHSRTVYRPGDTKHTLKTLVPCGSRLCLLDVTSSDDRTAKVIAVDPGGGKKEAWTAPAPRADLLVPVGDGVMVETTDSGDRYTAVLGPDGKDRLGDQGKDKTGVRVTAGSVLLFSALPGTYPADQSLYGFGLSQGAPTPLGDIKRIRSASCGWNTRLLVCPSDNDFGIWRFAK